MYVCMYVCMYIYIYIYIWLALTLMETAIVTFYFCPVTNIFCPLPRPLQSWLVGDTGSGRCDY